MRKNCFLFTEKTVAGLGGVIGHEAISQSALTKNQTFFYKYANDCGA